MRRIKRKPQFTLPTKYILLGMTVLCVTVMFLSFTFNLSGGPLNAVAGYVFVPMQKGINRVGMWIGDVSENFATLQEIKKENKELKSRLEEMTTENNRLQQNSATLERYKELYKMDQNTADYPKVAANVIASENSNWFSKFTIDKGSNDGIREDMNVLSGTGLVGIVTEVGPNWATVSSIIDDKNVSAMILTTFDKCIVSGDLQTVQDGLLKFEQLANNENEVAVGEQVVTSNISSKYLQGLLVGYISEVNVDSNNLTRSGYIIPATDFKELQEVLVITTTKQDLIDGKGESGSDNGGE
jgi:rod shape-determining protein MreC